ncbi:MAG: hypothetical protein P4M11_13425 [Candidatus Pacebacteria bacterium]|nr:hypothetical protein [Candidatus Paceibacterota bacterium]
MEAYDGLYTAEDVRTHKEIAEYDAGFRGLFAVQQSVYDKSAVFGPGKPLGPQPQPQPQPKPKPIPIPQPGLMERAIAAIASSPKEETKAKMPHLPAGAVCPRPRTPSPPPQKINKPRCAICKMTISSSKLEYTHCEARGSVHRSCIQSEVVTNGGGNSAQFKVGQHTGSAKFAARDSLKTISRS